MQHALEHGGAAEPELKVGLLDAGMAGQEVIQVFGTEHVFVRSHVGVQNRPDVGLVLWAEGHRGHEDVAGRRQSGDLGSLIVPQMPYELVEAGNGEVLALHYGRAIRGAGVAQVDPTIPACLEGFEPHAPFLLQQVARQVLEIGGRELPEVVHGAALSGSKGRSDLRATDQHGLL